MKNNSFFSIERIQLTFKQSTENISFAHVSYFYGQMGAGKSSIARLIDYCLGGKLELSPALQSEFVSATLFINTNSFQISIERDREVNQAKVSWTDKDRIQIVIVPCREPNGIVLPETKVETLSDLLFYLSGLTPPKVRRSKHSETINLIRLSFRDLMWYCYLDQDDIDSDFFNLGGDANPHKRLKSRDALRFILGFHQEKVAELESNLQFVNLKRLQLKEAANALSEALKDADVASENEIITRISSLKVEYSTLTERILELRINTTNTPHGTEILREKARILSYELQSLDDSIPLVANAIEQDTRHKNEILMLGIKVKRIAAARAVLNGVEFTSCPRCAQNLPERSQNECHVCGQEEPIEGKSGLNSDVIEEDAKSRISELLETIAKQTEQISRMRRRADEIRSELMQTNSLLTKQMQDYDSTYLSNALVFERKQAEISQHIMNYKKIIKLPQKVTAIQKEVNQLQSEESQIRFDLEEARKGAEADLTNIRRLQELFKDCLLRSELPGVYEDNEVIINPKDFLPVVHQPATGDVVVTSFANLTSGGKKTLFKVCYALAIHRLASEIGADLPPLLIIDSPMKNISERENVIQFEGLHKLIYDLASSELSTTQFILIDKEHFEPNPDIRIDFLARHMTPDNREENPPLIPYYVNKL